MRKRALRLRLSAMAGLTALALLGVAPETGIDAPAVNPAILDVTFAPDQLRAGAEFAVTIRTTPDIMSLVADVMKYKLPVPKAGDGVFYASARVPWWAHVYHGTFRVMFVGVAATGDEAQMEADVHI